MKESGSDGWRQWLGHIADIGTGAEVSRVRLVFDPMCPKAESMEQMEEETSCPPFPASLNAFGVSPSAWSVAD